MVYEGILEGKFVNLRSVREEDAEFILSIRNNPEISKYLPPLDVTVEQQKNWIAKQRNDDDSYYFIIEEKGSRRILGTISVYDIVSNHGESGRLCSIGESYDSIEAMSLFNSFVFNILHLDYLTGWVIDENKTVSSLNKRLGYISNGRSVSKDGLECETLVLTKENYLLKARKIKEIINSCNL